MAIFGQLMLLFSTCGQLMLPYSNDQLKLFNVFIVVVARFSDNLCFLFGQLMVQVAMAAAINSIKILGVTVFRDMASLN